MPDMSAEYVRHYAKKELERVKKRPVFKRAMRYIRTVVSQDGRRPSISAPSEIVGEFAAEQVAWLLRAAEGHSVLTLSPVGDGEVQMTEFPPDGATTIAWAVYEYLRRAQVFWWDTEIWNQNIAHAWPEDRDVAVGTMDIPFDVCWFTFENGISAMFPVRGGGQATVLIDGMIVVRSIDGMMIFSIGGANRIGSPTEVPAEPFAVGTEVKNGDVIPAGKGESMQASVLSALAFLNSPYASVSRYRANGKKIRGETPLPKQNPGTHGVHVVRLREPGQGGSQDPTHRKWQLKWRTNVRGHLRAQWYPSEKRHKLIYINPYVKGPEGAPIRETIYKVER